MLEIILGVAAVAALLAVAVFILAMRKPDSFSIERSIDIGASALDIYPAIANLPRMNTWNPFVQPDPAIEITYTGPASGKGAAHSWRGNRHVGEGRIEITEAEEPSRVEMRLQMHKPMKADNRVEFTLVPSAHGQTRVTWRMTGPQPLAGKLISLVLDCERMIGPVFEKGLSRLKSQVEQNPTAPAA